LPIISDTKLTNVFDEARAREIHLSQTCKRVFARAVHQAWEPKAHVAITPRLRFGRICTSLKANNRLSVGTQQRHHPSAKSPCS
jgi:hypothetical protein